MITDYDCWHEDHDHVTVTQVVQVLLANADNARALVARVAPALSSRTEVCTDGCQRALDHAVITPPEARDPAMIARLDAVAGRVLGGA
jgi:5'-methylthioadenosine phosphorylase